MENKKLHIRDMSFEEKEELAEAIWTGCDVGKYEPEVEAKLRALNGGRLDEPDDFPSLSGLYQMLESINVTHFINETAYPVTSDDNPELAQGGYQSELQKYFQNKFGPDVIIEHREFNTFALMYADPYYRQPRTFGKIWS